MRFKELVLIHKYFLGWFIRSLYNYLANGVAVFFSISGKCILHTLLDYIVLDVSLVLSIHRTISLLSIPRK